MPCSSLFVAAITIAAFAAPASAATVRVPADTPSVQAALDLADPGDTVLVAPGKYAACLVWPSTPGIKLLAEAGAGLTVLDARRLDQVIGIYSGVDSTTLIRGFTLTGGIAGGT
ncbi:hypothetical protein FJ251_15320 [bacterium]|nr:hypothetical protein [bacterium]